MVASYELRLLYECKYYTYLFYTNMYLCYIFVGCSFYNHDFSFVTTQELYEKRLSYSCQLNVATTPKITSRYNVPIYGTYIVLIILLFFCAFTYYFLHSL